MGSVLGEGDVAVPIAARASPCRPQMAWSMRGRPTDRAGRWGRLRLLTRLALGVGRGRQRLSGPRRGEAVRDRGRLQPVRCAELAQDVRDMHAGRPDADDECRRDLAVGVAAGEEGQDLRLPRREVEDLLQALLPVGRPGVRRREFQPCALGEQLKLFCQGRALRSGPRRRGPAGAARWPRRGRRRRRPAPRPGASGSRPPAAGAPAVPRSPRRDLGPRSGLATPRARWYSASARARQPSALGVTAAASAAASAAVASSFRARPSRSPTASPSRRARASAASSAWARSPLAHSQTRSWAMSRERARARPSGTDRSASVQRRSHRASSAR